MSKNNPFISRDTPRWSDNDIAKLNRAKGAKQARLTKAYRKRWREVDAPAKRQIATLLSYLLRTHLEAVEEIAVSWTGQTGRKLKNGAQYGKLLDIQDGFYFIVLPEGYKRPQRFHPGFWEILYD